MTLYPGPALSSKEGYGLVAKPEQVPGHCALSGAHEDREGFVDTGNSWPCGPSRFHVYASVSAVRHLARELGMIDPEKVEQVAREQGYLTAAEVQAQLAESAEFQQQAQQTVEALAADGFTYEQQIHTLEARLEQSESDRKAASATLARLSDGPQGRVTELEAQLRDAEAKVANLEGRLTPPPRTRPATKSKPRTSRR